MKWKREATEFLPEKTFLIIKDDLESLEAKENSIRRVKPKSALDTGTWPPKLKNHHHNHHHHQNHNIRSSVTGERPKTANLERPSVLDPRLLKKLDMSLVRKELLCDSMTRIHQSVKNRGGGGTARNTTSCGSRRRQSVPVGEKSCSFASGIPRKQISIPCYDVEQEKSTVSLPIVITISTKKRSIFENLTINETNKRNPEISVEPTPIMKKQSPGRRQNISSGDSQDNFSKKQIFEAKRLDDNNNKNNNNSNNNNNATATKISSLSSVKKNKASKIGVTTEIEVFTGVTTKVAPEPCKTCGRPDQPERFHSHPKGSIVMIKKDKDPVLSGKSKISIPKTIQKPVALNFRSEKSKRNKAQEEKKTISSPKGEKSKNTSPRDPTSKEEKNRSILGSAARKGPRTVTCYICAREFGTASFPIHEPKCMQKWERENNSLPVSQRRAVPQRPVVPVDHHDWNTAAWEQSQAQLVPCWKCGRTFLPDRLEIHDRSCKSTGKIRSSENSPIIVKTEKIERETSRNVTAPSTISCQICGRNFGTRSIKIHEPQCIKKWQAENESLPLSQRKKMPGRIERSADISSRERSQEPISPARLLPPQKPTTTCYICGRDFGSASIEIHEPQCLRKWQNENSKLPSHQQREEPQKPEIIYTTDETPTGSPIVDWAATTEARWKSHLGQLVPCKNCKRTFNPDRVAIHERSCKGIR